MTATAKFYTGFALVLALVIGVSCFAGYASGYRAGLDAPHARHTVSRTP